MERKSEGLKNKTFLESEIYDFSLIIKESEEKKREFWQRRPKSASFEMAAICAIISTEELAFYLFSKNRERCQPIFSIYSTTHEKRYKISSIRFSKLKPENEVYDHRIQ